MKNLFNRGLKIFFVVVLCLAFYSSSCENNSSKTTNKPKGNDFINDSIKHRDIKYFTKIQNITQFRGWVRDTVLSLSNYHEKGLKSLHYIIPDDSIYLDVRIKISDTVYSTNKNKEISVLENVLYTLEREYAVFPKLPFEARIYLVESFFMTDDSLLVDYSYSYDYLSLRNIGSNKEFNYTIRRGSLINTEFSIYQKEW